MSTDGSVRVSKRERSVSESPPENEAKKPTLSNSEPPKARRQITVYDAVAGRVGLNGFLNEQQLASRRIVPFTPEEVLSRRNNAPSKQITDNYYADQQLKPGRELPDSDLLKAIHSYASDFYARMVDGADSCDFSSLDETALIALGILIEEVAKDSLGVNGDMVLVEPEGMEGGLPRSKMNQYQIVGKVVPRVVQEYQSPSEQSETDETDERPRKRRHRRHDDELAPKKGMSQAQKLEKILNYFHDSRTCHTLKDLETIIPTATQVNKMQVKDLIKELTDTDQVKVEKIGSGNWYWAWAGEEETSKQTAINQLESEKTNLQESIGEMDLRLAQLKAAQATAYENPEFQQFLLSLDLLEAEVKRLANQHDEFQNAVVGGVENKRSEIESLKVQVYEMTDNVDALESWVQKQLADDPLAMEEVRRSCYDDQYVEGEGLPDIEDV